MKYCSFQRVNEQGVFNKTSVLTCGLTSHGYSAGSLCDTDKCIIFKTWELVQKVDSKEDNEK